MKHQEWTFVQQVASGLLGREQTCLLLSGVVSIVLMCGLAAPVSAQQSPAVSVGHDILSITYEDCLARAKQALELEGFAAERGGGNFYWGGKGIHYATIVCDGTPDNRIDVHVFVASTSRDGNVPGAERVTLQGRMNQFVSGSGIGATRGCGWQDGLDPTAPGDDQGRGIANGQTHVQHASGAGRANAHALVGHRMAALRACLPREAYARAYAAVSVRLAAVGRAQAGWIDGMDSRAPSDPGRGLSDAERHAAHVTSGAGIDTAHSLVVARLAELRDRISTESYARLYADLSVLIARYGVTGQGPA